MYLAYLARWLSFWRIRMSHMTLLTFTQPYCVSIPSFITRMAHNWPWGEDVGYKVNNYIHYWSQNIVRRSTNYHYKSSRLLPVTFEKCPLSQSTQVSCPVAFCAVPISQGSHSFCPDNDCADPATQSTHDVIPAWFWKVPRLQGLHVTLPGLEL